ncbi:flagellar assembly protein FliW [Sinanaerobacter sp. ZZT-01]|uniref:flagellar assembly protein FliW n=1 Tax=Sinanaerobacter sp. ZZT-01 TaxID=3111540 RepID=UPI002D772359|nr:flagellar assembly protein FliW [Sinanaerobacter sp. ZZT-01]WRR93588.1 flagellar assembly protein FliW [Sinanaerobacter sp. ZZT-01]
MKINTKYFGEVEINSKEVLSFSKGLFGFESEKEFVLMHFDEEDSIYCLQSLIEPSLAFIVLNPFNLFPQYKPQLSDSELKSLSVSSSTDLFYYVITVLREPFHESTVNLKCPIAVNLETKKARQIILENENYSMRETFISKEEKEGLSCSY